MVFNSNTLSNFPIISDQIKRPALEVVLGQLARVLEAGVSGDVVEFGCYIGTTSLFIRRLLDADEKLRAGATGQPASQRQFHVYDSFAGLPPKTSPDASAVGADFVAGELSVSKKQLLGEFAKARLQPPVIHKGWFNQLQSSDVPDQMAFAFLDGDFYESILDSLKLVWPRMQPGSIVCVDDCQREALPGVDKAIKDYFQGTPPAMTVSHNIGVLVKPKGKQ